MTPRPGLILACGLAALAVGIGAHDAQIVRVGMSACAAGVVGIVTSAAMGDA